MHLRRDFDRFMALGRAQRCTLLMAAAWLPVFWLGLRLFGLARFQALLRRVQTPTRRESMTPEAMQALGRLVNAAAIRTIGPDNCLTRSLLLDWLLHRKGVDSRLRIGVRMTQGVLSAHAWVDVDGLPVNDRPDVGLEFPPFGDLVPLDAFQT